MCHLILLDTTNWLQVLGGGTMKIRTNDAAYLTHVDRWWSELLPRMTRLLYSNGGPIVMVQVLSSSYAERNTLLPVRLQPAQAERGLLMRILVTRHGLA